MKDPESGSTVREIEVSESGHTRFKVAAATSLFDELARLPHEVGLGVTQRLLRGASGGYGPSP